MPEDDVVEEPMDYSPVGSRSADARTREIAEALRLEGYIYNCYGPRAAEFIEAQYPAAFREERK